MNTAKQIKGDIIKLACEGHFDILIHGCNCFCKMGAGLALQIKEQFPEAYEADLRTKPGDKNKLGRSSACRIKRFGYEFIVINAYTQYYYGRKPGSTYLEYWTIDSMFKAVGDWFSHERIAYPKIGAGLAGGDWETIYTIIKTRLKGCDHTLVTL